MVRKNIPLAFMPGDKSKAFFTSAQASLVRPKPQWQSALSFSNLLANPVWPVGVTCNPVVNSNAASSNRPASTATSPWRANSKDLSEFIVAKVTNNF